MDAEIIALINSGATTLLGLMVTDAWSRTKKVTASLLTRGQDNMANVESDLEDSRTRLQAAIEAGDSEVEAELTAEWRSRLRRAVENDDTVIESLREFVSQNGNLVADYADRVSRISLTANARDNSRIYQQGQGTQHNY